MGGDRRGVDHQGAGGDRSDRDDLGESAGLGVERRIGDEAAGGILILQDDKSATEEIAGPDLEVEATGAPLVQHGRTGEEDEVVAVGADLHAQGARVLEVGDDQGAGRRPRGDQAAGLHD